MSYAPICTHEWNFWNGLKGNWKIAFMKIFAFLCEGFHLFEQQFSGCVRSCGLISSYCYTSTAKPWTSLYMDGTAVILLADLSTWGLSLGPKLQGWIFWTMTISNLKKFTSRSIYWGVKLYLESTGSYSSTALSWQITDFGFSQQSQNWVRFWFF